MKEHNKRKQSKKWTSVMYQLFCVLLGLFLASPVIYALLVSFMRPGEVLTKELHLLPDTLYLGNYITAVTQTKIFRFLINSFIVAFGSSVIRMVTSSLAAFSFSFFGFKGKQTLFYLVVGSMIIPADVLVVQNYFTVAQMGLINTYTGMMAIFLVSAMNIFVIRQNFMTYSASLRDAALVDGCSNFKFFVKILVPSSSPVLTTVFISSFVGTWNTYLWPLIVTNVNEMRTAQVSITMLNVSDASSYGAVMAASIIILVPSILVFLIFQKKIIGGMMAGSVKG